MRGLRIKMGETRCPYCDLEMYSFEFPDHIEYCNKRLET